MQSTGIIPTLSQFREERMANSYDTVKRLSAAGVLDATDITLGEDAMLNSIEITDAEIDALVSIKKRLELSPLRPRDALEMVARKHL
jgi:hypothetical protein